MARSIAGTAGNFLANAAANATATPLTLACWFRPDNVTTYYTLMNVQTRPTPFLDSYHVLGINGAAGGDPVIAETAFSGTYVSASTSSGYSANTWQHACAVFASSTSRSVYLNGGSKGTDTSSCTPNTANYTQLGGFSSSSTNFDSLAGRIAEAGIWAAALTDAEVLALARGFSPLLIRPDALVNYWPLIGRASPEPDLIGGLPLTITGTVSQAEHVGIIMPRAPWVPGPASAAASGGTVNQVNETDTAQPVTGSQARAVGQASETDLAQAITLQQRAGVAQASETDAAQPISARHVGTIGQVVETDSAQPITALQSRALGQAAETDAAQAVVPIAAATLGQASETDLAQAVSLPGSQTIGVAQVEEADSAQTLTARHAGTLGQAAESDAAQAVTAPGAFLVGQVMETDAAQAISGRLIGGMGQAAEGDAAQALSVGIRVGVGQAVETDSAHALSVSHRLVIGQCTETDAALNVTPPGAFLIATAAESDEAQALQQLVIYAAAASRGKRIAQGAGRPRNVSNIRRR